MADAIEVAIEHALTDQLLALPASPSVPISLPEVPLAVTPDPTVIGACYLKADFLPAPTMTVAIAGRSSNQHQGLFQVSVFWRRGEGQRKAERLAAQVIRQFKRGTSLFSDGFRIDIVRAPFMQSMRVDGAWIMIPVTIPYLSFALDPA